MAPFDGFFTARLTALFKALFSALNSARRALASCLGLAGLVLLPIALLGPERAWGVRSFSPHEGYLADVAGERNAPVSEVVLVQPPSSDGPTLRERIFNDKLSKEFRIRYEEKFGRTEAQRAYSFPNKFTYYDDLYGFRGTPEQVDQERRRFGEFMIRRLAEWHFDNYAQNEPKMRPVLEAKEALSNVKIEVQEFRLDVIYGLSGNVIDFDLINPYLNSKITLQMDPGSIGPGPVQETILALRKPVSPTLSLESYFHLSDGIVSLIGRKALAYNLSTSVSASTFTKDHGRTRRESVYLSGLSYSFWAAGVRSMWRTCVSRLPFFRTKSMRKRFSPSVSEM